MISKAWTASTRSSSSITGEWSSAARTRTCSPATAATAPSAMRPADGPGRVRRSRTRRDLGHCRVPSAWRTLALQTPPRPKEEHMHTVKDVMTTGVVAVEEKTSFKDIVDLMHRQHVSTVPVLDSTGQVHGVVSKSDLLLKEADPDAGEEFRFTAEARREQH